MSTPPGGKEPPRLLSVVIPARDEEGSVGETVQGVFAALGAGGIAHEIVVVDDGSSDRTWEVLERLRATVPTLRPVRNPGPHGFGRAVTFGLDCMQGDAVAVVMGDGSDDPADLVRYHRELARGFDCVFGSRFAPGGAVEGYPRVKLLLNRLGNTLLRLLFGIPHDDLSNAFKAYRREVIEAVRPLASAHFDLNIEIPIKAALRGFTWTTVPVAWRGRKAGEAKLRVGRMAGVYLRTAWRLWRER